MSLCYTAGLCCMFGCVLYSFAIFSILKAKSPQKMKMKNDNFLFSCFKQGLINIKEAFCISLEKLFLVSTRGSERGIEGEKTETLWIPIQRSCPIWCPSNTGVWMRCHLRCTCAAFTSKEVWKYFSHRVELYNLGWRKQVSPWENTEKTVLTISGRRAQE